MMHLETLVITLQLSTVEELPSAQQRIYVLSVEQMSINVVAADRRIETLQQDDIHHFQTNKRLSFPLTAAYNENDDNGDCIFSPPIILNRLIQALHSGKKHKLILRKWKQGAKWWNLNMNHTSDDTSSSSSFTTTTIGNSSDNNNNNNTVAMARAEVAGYRLAKLAMNHHSQQHLNNNNKKKKRKISAYVPDVVYFSHDDNDTVDTEGDDPWALFSYFGSSSNRTEGLDDDENDERNNIDINIINNSNLNWDIEKAVMMSIANTPQLSSSHHNHLIECKHYPSTMTKIRHEFGFDEPHPRHGRVPIDECSDYAHIILRDVVLPVQFSFFEWSSSSSSSSSIQSSVNGVEWKHNLCALAVDSQTSKPFQYHDMIAVYRLALQRLSSSAQQTASIIDDERMDTLLQMMQECVTALEHEWDDGHDDNYCQHPPPLPAVVCHMDLQPQNLTFWHDRTNDSEKKDTNVNVHDSKHCSVASVMDFEEAAYADPRFEVLLICRKVLANLEQAKELWESYSSSVKLQTTWDVGPIEPWLRLETVHSLFTLLLQANNLLGGGRNPWETKPDLWGKIDRERMRLVRMGWSFCSVD